MKTTNLVVAIIYTILLLFMMFVAINDNDGELMLGTLMLSVPTIVNWITFFKLGKK